MTETIAALWAAVKHLLPIKDYLCFEDLVIDAMVIGHPA